MLPAGLQKGKAFVLFIKTDIIINIGVIAVSVATTKNWRFCLNFGELALILQLKENF